ncbi:splicing factor U2AF 26 kDa subunit-like isoform X2 [Schistocerca gregaria]|uniref:splicing factor U2AF 26 kDa subunit-like isoform X2 n=1 Tax=Schistocerca gregaria TaxID=7010 RepID=UPI00211DB585|nr:splicing factor U2AF 26 kDa subunit-like isoform X2 [Schistocerca gregaria]
MERNKTGSSRVNCSFFFKMGACRHGEKCDRRHNRPTESPTVLFTNMYQSPLNYLSSHGDNVYDSEELKFLDEFYEDVFVELSKYGEIEDLNICANPGQHLNGNVYVKFRLESQAANVVKRTVGRMYDGRHIKAELSPVTDFGEARCRQYAVSECDRKMCNFMHLREPNKRLRRQLFQWQAEQWRKRNIRSISPRKDSPPPRKPHLSPRRRSPRHPSTDPFGRDLEPRRDRDVSEEEHQLRKQLLEIQQARKEHEDQEKNKKRKRNETSTAEDSSEGGEKQSKFPPLSS